MDFVSIREFRTQPGKVWEKLEKEQELIVTRNGKPFAILTGTSPTELDEDLRELSRRRFGKALTAIREEAKAKRLDKMTLEEINAVISEVRQERRRRESGA